MKDDNVIECTFQPEEIPLNHVRFYEDWVEGDKTVGQSVGAYTDDGRALETEAQVLINRWGFDDLRVILIHAKDESGTETHRVSMKMRDDANRDELFHETPRSFRAKNACLMAIGWLAGVMQAQSQRFAAAMKEVSHV